MYNINNRDSDDLQQHLRKDLEGVAKKALEQEYAYESQLIDDDSSKSTGEKIQAHRESLRFYLFGVCGICIFSYCANYMIKFATGR